MGGRGGSGGSGLGLIVVCNDAGSAVAGSGSGDCHRTGCVSASAGRVPRDMCAVIENGMERDPSRRYASMTALHEDLQALCMHLPVKARAIRAPERWLRAARRRPGAVAAVLAVVLAVGVAVPVTMHWRDDVHAATEERHTRYLAELAALPPSIAFEGSLQSRQLLDADERQGYLARLDRVLALAPDDDFARLLRSALLLDQGDLAGSLADIELLTSDDDGRGESTPSFARAFRERYAAIDTEKPGVLGLDLDGLPPPQTDRDRVVLGFQLYRCKRAADALEVLEAGTSRHAVNLRMQARYASAISRQDLQRVLAEVDELERRQRGRTARSAYLRGLALRAAGDAEAALTAFEASAALCPDAYGTRFNIAMLHVAQQRPLAALRELHAARALRPANLNASQQIVSVLAELGRHDEATAEVERMPSTGHTAEPWHREYLRGYVNAWRAYTEYGAGREQQALEAEQRAVAHYRTAQQSCEPGSADYRWIAESIAARLLDGTTPQDRFDGLVRMLDDNPSSSVLLTAFARACAEAMPLDAARQQIMQNVLEAAAERARRRAAIDQTRETVPQKPR